MSQSLALSRSHLTPNIKATYSTYTTPITTINSTAEPRLITKLVTTFTPTYIPIASKRIITREVIDEIDVLCEEEVSSLKNGTEEKIEWKENQIQQCSLDHNNEDNNNNINKNNNSNSHFPYNPPSNLSLTSTSTSYSTSSPYFTLSSTLPYNKPIEEEKINNNNNENYTINNNNINYSSTLSALPPSIPLTEEQYKETLLLSLLGVSNDLPPLSHIRDKNVLTRLVASKYPSIIRPLTIPSDALPPPPFIPLIIQLSEKKLD